ncbi:PHP domain-containing protein [Thermoanaerobacter sp. RKWS2]|uniref:PHP domain-containing protein n=1 Tax=Thermoanaerobacter sp. RKWS2 TaxID=2983842 RepID=UPI00224A5076|nr:PHP domain-containing protein [Thermoanaerobacter sp. RKWS2]UZQ84176.1 PHP domain-containing protein [Thermoanaerobacter sp. RKWS2]
MFADLHMHSKASDGTNSPSEVVRLAKEHGLSCISLTDHDTIDGLEEAIGASSRYEIEVIPGIEFNCYYQDQEIHILGYFINYHDKNFTEKLEEMKKLRDDRAKAILKELNELGIDISIEDVLEFTSEKFIGRPHIARAMVKKNYVESVKEAFEKYIGVGAPAYVERYRITPFEAINLILENGGVPVLAHPGLLQDDSIIEELAPKGLIGIEVYHSKHTTEDIEKYLNKAKKYKLIITGGSDFHGIEVDGRDLLGTIKLDYEYVKILKSKAKNFVEISK